MDMGAPSSSRNATSHDVSWRWNSPIPYLYGGLAVIIGLIALSLAVLACYPSKSSEDNSSSGDDNDVKNPSKRALSAVRLEPEIVVIMAGNDQPTHLANPVSSI
ncbi:Glutamine dumper like [Thalictrum thalictroides]|uniref:Glutamine dumper like n=1 Tax=Thalictrum thalictroides TaxID=46969 RepID=A0A7J6X7P7_THATH|nr:Glutamine dumper like [Thalictrum thalictroides]